MKTSKEHQLLKDIVKRTKSIRLSKFVTMSEIDAHLGFSGICKAIESASWCYQPTHNKYDESITMYQFMLYAKYIDTDFVVYSDEPLEEDTIKNANNDRNKIMRFVDHVIKNLIEDHKNKPTK